MSKKLALITGILILAIILGIVGYYIHSVSEISKTPEQPTPEQPSTPTPSPTPSPEREKIIQVLIKVEYDGEWQGAYGDVSAIVSWDRRQ